ncbi:MAG TPA: NADH-quinone oxidoreductase subunit C [candidate division Zixibacteria bacterium]|nr:NADH-quinone oxidoreductase subunit C [candidate division Zixibacteria bacterium]
MTKEELVAYIGSHFEGKLTPVETGKFDPWFEIKPDDLLEVMQKLHDDNSLKFDFLCNLSGVDTGEHFEVAYSLASIGLKHRMDVKLSLPYEGAEVESVQKIWAGANWHEREAWELYGINFKNHGNLTRFLLPDEWDQGHPMRKDWDGPDFVRLPEV